MVSDNAVNPINSNRYARQIIVPAVGTDGQQRLRNAKVLVVGAGGLAAPLLPILAGAGVGQITIIDGDNIEITNLHRQTLFSEADCGKAKAQVAAERCQQLNSEIAVNALVQNITPDNAPELVTNADIVLDCADSYAVSYLLSDVCVSQQKPLISASVLGLSGYVGGFCGIAPSLRAVFPEAPDSGASCASAGVLGSVVAMIGALQAQMALALLLELGSKSLGQIVQFDALSLRTSTFRFDNALEPDSAFHFVALSQLRDDDLIIELRDEDEAPMPIHANAKRILSTDISEELPKQLTNSNQRLVLCCATGLRSWRVAEQLQRQDKYAGEIVLLAATAS